MWKIDTQRTCSRFKVQDSNHWLWFFFSRKTWDKLPFRHFQAWSTKGHRVPKSCDANFCQKALPQIWSSPEQVFSRFLVNKKNPNLWSSLSSKKKQMSIFVTSPFLWFRWDSWISFYFLPRKWWFHWNPRPSYVVSPPGPVGGWSLPRIRGRTLAEAHPSAWSLPPPQKKKVWSRKNWCTEVHIFQKNEHLWKTNTHVIMVS